MLAVTALGLVWFLGPSAALIGVVALIVFLLLKRQSEAIAPLIAAGNLSKYAQTASQFRFDLFAAPLIVFIFGYLFAVFGLLAAVPAVARIWIGWNTGLVHLISPFVPFIGRHAEVLWAASVSPDYVAALLDVYATQWAMSLVMSIVVLCVLLPHILNTSCLALRYSTPVESLFKYILGILIIGSCLYWYVYWHTPYDVQLNFYQNPTSIIMFSVAPMLLPALIWLIVGRNFIIAKIKERRTKVKNS